MIIVGMTGPIGHGKSTFAKALKEAEPSTKRLESSLIIAEVANELHSATDAIPQRDDINSINNWLKPLPSILAETVHVISTFGLIKIDPGDVSLHPSDYEKLFLHIDNLNLNPQMLTEKINSDNKEAFRPILQWLGGYLVDKVDSKIWYRELIRRAYRLDDQGYELCIIGGLRFPSDSQVVHEAGGKVIKVYRPEHLQYDLLDPTERERDSIEVDSTVVSDSGVEDIKKAAATILTDLRNNNLQSTYVVSQMSKVV